MPVGFTQKIRRTCREHLRRLLGVGFTRGYTFPWGYKPCKTALYGDIVQEPTDCYVAWGLGLLERNYYISLELILVSYFKGRRVPRAV